jgi:hypothetical protein
MMSLVMTSIQKLRCYLPSGAALLAFALALLLRLLFIPVPSEPMLYDPDEAEMHEASLGPVLGTVPQRLIWPGGLMRHAALAHLGVSALSQGVPRSPDGLAAHIGQVLLEPGQAWAWMRWVSAFGSAMGFALAVWLSVRLGSPWPWAVALGVAAACFPLHWRHGCMATSDALAWGLALAALTAARAGCLTLERVLGSALLTGLALGSKMTLLPMLPALALVCWDPRWPWLRWLLVWSCGFLLGALLATPWFLADPVRLVKTMLGVVKFKPGEEVGLAETFLFVSGGIPPWLLAVGCAGLAVAFSRKQERALAAGVVLSALWLLNTAAGSKQVVERYFPPLGMLLLFSGFLWLLPWLASWIQGRRRHVISVMLALLTFGSLVQGWQALATEMAEMRARRAGYLEVRSLLEKAAARRVAVHYTLFRSPLAGLADSGSFDRLAEHLERARVGHRGVEPMLAAFGMSTRAVSVLGGLFDEVEVNQAARLRALAAAARGRCQVSWFHDGDNLVYARQWQQDRQAVLAALAARQVDAAVFAGQMPPELPGHSITTLPGKVPLHVLLATSRPGMKP